MTAEKREALKARNPNLWDKINRQADVTPESAADGTLHRLVQELRLHQVELEAQNEALHEAHRVSEAALARYTELYDFAPVGYVTLDRTGVITRANHAAVAVLRSMPSRIGAQRLGAFVADESLPEFAVFLGRVLGSTTTQSCEVTLRPVAGQAAAVAVVLEGRAAANGEDVIVALIDITERTRVQVALQQAKDEAERASLAKSRFLAAASHDLRQPQQTLYLINGVMARRCGDDRLRDLIVSQDEALEVMSGMLNNLLDINEIEAGITTPDPIGFCVDPMLNRLAHDFAFRAGSGGNAWRVVPSRLVVRSDPKLLERILRNLLSNAFKYTDHGKVLLGCRRYGSHVRIDVCDNGVGIAADQIEDIFKEYVQIESSIRPPCRGLGLGLAIVRRQAALLNHPLHVRSTPGQGSVFSIEVPLAETAAAQVVAPPMVPLNAPILQRKILVVEGDDTVSGTLKSLFLAEGAAVVTTTDESKLTAIIEQMSGAPDLLVTDYALTDGLTGLDVVARVRAASSSDLPAIVLTGDIPTETAREIAAVPGCLHLPKPVTFSELMRSAAILLSRSARRASAAAKGATVFVIDDDGPLREAMASLLEEEGLPVELYPHAEAFLDHVGPSRQGCLLIDAVMPGMGGLELLRHLRSRNSRLPAIMMTGHGDVAMAVAAMKEGAIDFVTKPVHPAGLLATIGRALEIERDMVAEVMQREEAMVLISSLTPRENDVLEQLLAGHRNKTIAYCLGISQRTVENHRAAVMRKTKSKALFDLLQTVIVARS